MDWTAILKRVWYDESGFSAFFWNLRALDLRHKVDANPAICVLEFFSTKNQMRLRWESTRPLHLKSSRWVTRWIQNFYERWWITQFHPENWGFMIPILTFFYISNGLVGSTTQLVFAGLLNLEDIEGSLVLGPTFPSQNPPVGWLAFLEKNHDDKKICFVPRNGSVPIQKPSEIWSNPIGGIGGFYAFLASLSIHGALSMELLMAACVGLIATLRGICKHVKFGSKCFLLGQLHFR